jgi:hypothetical protein
MRLLLLLSSPSSSRSFAHRPRSLETPPADRVRRSVAAPVVALLCFFLRATRYTQGMNEVLAAFINLFVDELRWVGSE